jgi:hypothetical protein
MAKLERKSGCQHTGLRTNANKKMKYEIRDVDCYVGRLAQRMVAVFSCNLLSREHVTMRMLIPRGL